MDNRLMLHVEDRAGAFVMFPPFGRTMPKERMSLGPPAADASLRLSYHRFAVFLRLSKGRLLSDWELPLRRLERRRSREAYAGS